MTELEILKFIEECGSKFESYHRFFFITRGIELQQASANELDGIKEKIGEVLKDSQQQNFCDTSNKLRAFMHHASSLSAELRMYIHLKQDKMSEAWDTLIDAQTGTLWAMRAHAGIRKSLEPRAARLDLLERLLFPAQVFFSTGFTVRSSQCSICGKEYKECEHVKGRIYNGDFCARVISKADLKEVSIVEDPADKRCRAYSFGEGENMRDTLTYRQVPQDGEKTSGEERGGSVRVL